MSNDNLKFNFHIEEYKSLRVEANNFVNHLYSIVKFVIPAIGLIMAWLGTNSFYETKSAEFCSVVPRYIFVFLWSSPFMMACFGFTFSILVYKHLYSIGKYLQKIEAHMAENSLGWDRFLAKRAPRFHLSIMALWSVVVVGTATFAMSAWFIFPDGIRPCWEIAGSIPSV